MRKIIMMLVLSLLLFSDETSKISPDIAKEDTRFTIQVISMKNERSLTEDFLTRVKSVGLPYSKKMVDGSYKIFVGSFASYKEAAAALVKVRRSINEGAFVTREAAEPVVLGAQQKMQQAMIMAQARTLQKMKEDKSEISETTLAVVEPIKSVATDASASKTAKEQVSEHSKKEKSTIAGKAPEINLSAEEPGKEFCKPSKKALRESEIADALAFYRSSSFYRFDRQ